MSDELFGGNIASEITLGEAIVRGILNPPKYVLSVFSYQKDLEKYEKRVRFAKSKAVRDEGEQYLEALRRALEEADGMETIFQKYMEDPSGKYIVFCANFDHKQDMIAMAPQWFSGVDNAPHIYCAYSDDPETDKAFAAFKADNSNHLKLLYCIDMLNEGIHLLNSARFCKKGQNRRTELTAEQVARLDALGMNWVGKHNATWDIAYAEACKYRQEYGNLNVPSAYVTENGIRLGRWIRSQREVYKTTLSESRKKKLDALGMAWQPEDPWSAKFRLVQRYCETHGHTNMPTDYVVDGVWLRRWLSEQKARLNGKPTGRSKTVKTLTPEQIQQLSTVGIKPRKAALEVA